MIMCSNADIVEHTAGGDMLDLVILALCGKIGLLSLGLK